ncbi:MAG: glycine cleavage system protein GcvH [Chitinispirillia bacterium]|jgi:glycine cleavage system H protein
MVLDDRKYNDSHEWIKIENGLAVVGISDHAQDSLGDITFVELPEIDKKVSAGDECCVIESVKAASDIYAPCSGTVAEVNIRLESTPEEINSSPYESGWIFKLKDFNTAEIDDLMDAASYTDYLEAGE